MRALRQHLIGAAALISVFIAVASVFTDENLLQTTVIDRGGRGDLIRVTLLEEELIGEDANVEASDFTLLAGNLTLNPYHVMASEDPSSISYFFFDASRLPSASYFHAMLIEDRDGVEYAYPLSPFRLKSRRSFLADRGEEGSKSEFGLLFSAIQTTLIPVGYAFVSALLAALLATATFVLWSRNRGRTAESEPPVKRVPPVEHQPTELKQLVVEGVADIKKAIDELASSTFVADKPEKASKEVAPVVTPSNLPRVVENHWASEKSWMELLERTPSGFNVYEWLGFSDILKTQAPSTVTIQLVPATSTSQGVVFLGARSSSDGTLAIFPLTVRSFRGDNGLAVLRALFELTPPVSSKRYRFTRAERPCQLRRQGEGFRIHQKGRIGIDQPGATERAPTVPPTRSSSPSLPPSEQSSGFTQNVLRKVVSEEVGRGLRQAASSDDLRQVEQKLAKLERAIVPLIRALEGWQAESRSEQAALPPVEFNTPAVRQVSEGSRSSSATPQSERLPPKRTQEPRCLAFTESRLHSLDVREHGKEPDYPRALGDLRQFFESQGVDGDCGTAFFQVQPNNEEVDLREVKIDPSGQQFITHSGTKLNTSPFQVLLGIYDRPSGDAPTACALLFPWNRLTKGAPFLVSVLVNERLSGPMVEYVRCEKPALVTLGDSGRYTVRQKMIVQPVGSSRNA